MNAYKNISEYTRLPVECVEYPGTTAPIIFVLTPHMGKVAIQTKKKTLFTNREKGADEIISELFILQRESESFLLGEWIKSITDK